MDGHESRKAYPSDLSDAEWALLEPLVPTHKQGGRPARWSRREVVNGILYVVRGGNQWRALPHDLPPLAYGVMWIGGTMTSAGCSNSPKQSS